MTLFLRLWFRYIYNTIRLNNYGDEMVLSAFLQKLMFVNQFSVDKGKVEVLGSRYIMLDASDLLVLQDLDQGKVYEGAKKNAKANLDGMVKHANVYHGIKDQSLKNIAELSKKVGKNDEGVIKTLQQIFGMYGLGDLTIVDLKNDKKSARLMIHDSTIAVAQLQRGKSSKPVCSITAGILAGIFSYIFGSDVNCYETKCLAVTGSGNCEFEIR